ncbi:hypothetical protein BD410DRAFT_839844 [Rickenella mellea]|uniref:Pyridoxamine 5'-phosphate oxidase putative domain-containing protein n=1 Tax=Rickenella mellea TaxID=50990 RepID=A0A4Y7Q5G5_9AGAM|nr:hypothetical protein BD410DRAFT_839844 [Rickenella mellea]
MGQVYDHIPQSLIDWIQRQHVFWVATAPLAQTGHVNVSPKGLEGTFHIDGPNRVWYEDMTGSGCETIAHIRENGRITFHFVSLDTIPKIVRLYGKGLTYEFGTPEYERFIPISTRRAGSRAVIVSDIHRVSTSCGWGVPIYKFQTHRTKLVKFSYTIEDRDLAFQAQSQDGEGKAENGLKAYWAKTNQFSIDNLPGLSSCLDTKVPLANGGPVTPVPEVQSTKPMKRFAPLKIEIADLMRVFFGFVLGILVSFLLRGIEALPHNILEWILKQEMFWVATAPLAAHGHVNVSPKGVRNCFHIVDANKVWYEDLTGSGNETISHLRENGRITVMFNAFDGPPRITRLFGKGIVHEFGTPEYDALIPECSRQPGSRAAIVVEIHKVSTSCGYTVPYYDFRSHRTMLLENMKRREEADAAVAENGTGDLESEKMAEKGLKAYWINKNSTSLDGLPGLCVAPYTDKVPRSELDIQLSRQGGGVAEQPVTTAVVEHVKSVYDDLKLIVAFGLGLIIAMASVNVTSRMGVV